jgi:hypothetical protein
MVEPARHQRIDDALSGMAEWRMSEVVAERNRFGELFVEPQDFGDGPGNLRHLERVRQPGPIVVTSRRKEHLRLVLQPTERLGVNDAIPVALKRRTNLVFRFRSETPSGVGTLRRLRSEDLELAALELLTERHASASGARRELGNEPIEKAGSMHERSDAEQIGKRLTEVGKGGARSEVDALPHVRPGE